MIYKAKYDNDAYSVVLEVGYYLARGNVGIMMVDESDGSPVTNITVNLPEYVASDEVAIKDYSENEGMLEWLLENSIVSPPHRHVQSGFVNYPICRLLIDPATDKRCRV